MAKDTQAPRFVSYLRVSTAKQGASGLGLEAQRHAVSQYLARWAGAVALQEFVEVESGKNEDRTQLKGAMELALLTGATLVIAKLDRLSRDLHFLTGLRKSGLKFVACDNPEANNLTVNILAAVAEQELVFIKERTKAALQAAKAKGVKLGNPNGALHLRGLGNSAAVAGLKQKADERAHILRKKLEDIQSAGHKTLIEIAQELERQSITTPRGGKWHPMMVSRLLTRLGMTASAPA